MSCGDPDNPTSSQENQQALARFCELATTVTQMRCAGIYDIGDSGIEDPTFLASSSHYPDAKSTRAILDVIAADQLSKGIVVLPDIDGAQAWSGDDEQLDFAVVAPLLDNQDEPMGLLVLLDDHHRQFDEFGKQNVDNLAKTARDLVEARRARRLAARQRRELKRSNQQLEQFAYVASHDLQEPLRMVTGFLDLLEEEYAPKLDDDAREYIDFAVNGARRMKSLIDGLLEYSRMWSSEAPFVDVDTGAVLREVRKQITNNYDDLDITIELDDRLPVIPARRAQMERLFTNLLTNAVKYSDGDPAVKVTCQREGNHLHFAVSDSGRGIPEKQQQRIFDIFVSGPDQSRHENSGIGLAICKAITEEHGGEIWVDSAPGDGSTFHITISNRSTI